MSATLEVKRWQITAGLLGAVCAPAVAILADRMMVRSTDFPSAGEVRAIFREEVEPIKVRLSALETRTSLAEAELATYRSQFLPRLSEIASKMGAISEDIAYIKGKWEKQ